VANVLVLLELVVVHVTNVQMGTLEFFPIADPVTVNLVTQLEIYVIKLMEHAHVWTDLVEKVVIFVKMNFTNILTALIVHAKKTAQKITPTFVT
jgi:hypothetical protein